MFIAILLNVLCTLLPIGSTLLSIYIYNADVTQGVQYIVYAFTVLSYLQWVLFREPFKRMYTEAIHKREYDEFGNSKKKKWENLTRAEREEIDLQRASQMEQLLPTALMKKITKKGSTDPEGDLEKLIGLTSVKNRVKEIIARMEFDGRSGHYVFYGSAGTGKTTVARIMTGLLYKYHYIKENKCIEIDGNFLKAGEMSDTKTKMIIQKAYGGVLFIDEAYTMINGIYGGTVVATLIKEMEDNRDKFTVILAGYKEDMKRLLDSNEGFKSRIKDYIEFSDYSVEEMKEIFVNMAGEKGFVVTGDTLGQVEIRCRAEKRLPSFGNGRTVRNILEETIDRHAVNWTNGNLFCKIGDVNYDNTKCKWILCPSDVSTLPSKTL